MDNYSSIGYDLAGNVTSVTSTLDGTTDYTRYDAENELKNVTGASSLTPATTRTAIAPTAVMLRAQANRLLSDGTFDYTYDQNGNLIKQVQIAGTYSTTYETDYTWDYENRPVGVTYYDNSHALQQSITYTYDYLGNVIREYVSTAPQPYAYTVYDGGQPLLQFSDTTQLSGSGTPTRDRPLPERERPGLGRLPVQQVQRDDHRRGLDSAGQPEAARSIWWPTCRSTAVGSRFGIRCILPSAR